MYWSAKRFADGQGPESLVGPKQLPFPDIEPLSAFRKMWYLEKRARMRIPAPHRTQLPQAKSDSKETRARLYSVYLRPWTLLEQQKTAEVLYLGELGTRRTRYWGKQPQTHYWSNWMDYLQKVVSEHQKRIIQQFLSITEVLDVADPEPAGDASEPTASQTPTQQPSWNIATVHRLLEGLTKQQKGKHGSQVIRQSLEVGKKLWDPEHLEWPDALVCKGHLNVKQSAEKVAEDRKKE